MTHTELVSEHVLGICRVLGHCGAVVAMLDRAVHWIVAAGQAAAMARHLEFSIEYDHHGRLVSGDRFCLMHLPSGVASECLSLFGTVHPTLSATIARHAANARFGVGAAVDGDGTRHKLYVIGNSATVSHEAGLAEWLASLVATDPQTVEQEFARFGHRTKGYCLDVLPHGIGLKLYHGLMQQNEFFDSLPGPDDHGELADLAALAPRGCPILVCSRWMGAGWSRRMELRLMTTDLSVAHTLFRRCGIDPDAVAAHAQRLRATTDPILFYLSIDRDRRARTTLYFRPGV